MLLDQHLTMQTIHYNNRCYAVDAQQQITKRLSLAWRHAAKTNFTYPNYERLQGT